jgi:predicted PurR-regulated permease PerM
MKLSLGLVAGVAVIAAIAYARAVFAPLALAFFIMALVWPMQRRLQARLPKLLALAITLVVTLAVATAFGSLVAWGFGRVIRSLVADAARYQAMYEGLVGWLAGHGVSIAGFWAEHFNVTWMLRMTQLLTGRVNTTLTFWLITVIYVMLGLLEVNEIRRRLEALDNSEVARLLLNGSAMTAARFRTYMLVRTEMSLLTGLLVGAFAWTMSLQFAAEWGVIAFALNYIPFIGPFAATLFPTLLAMAHFDSWQEVVTLFACLNVIQFAIGSYIEPRIAGNMLSISPPLVLFATLLWTSLWGLFGTFIGVPITIAVLSFCAEHRSSRWIAELFGGSKPAVVDKPQA